MKLQEKMDVIDPDTGDETFVIVHFVAGRKLVRKMDVIKYELFGLTNNRIFDLTQKGIINLYQSNGGVKQGGRQRAYVDITEVQRVDFNYEDAWQKPLPSTKPQLVFMNVQ